MFVEPKGLAEKNNLSKAKEHNLVPHSLKMQIGDIYNSKDVSNFGQRHLKGSTFLILEPLYQIN